ncbi:MAG: hypothetical protein ACI4VT_06105 [Bacilli bacterium]
MTKNEIINDIKFRQQCGRYGLDWEKFQIYNDIILLDTPTKSLYVFMDKNYNVFGIEEWDPLIKTFPSFVNGKCYEYLTYTSVFEYEDGFNYPFQEYTLKQLIDLSNRIEIMETNHGHTLCTRVNGDWYDRNYGENEDEFQLLSYIKFLGEELKQYFLLNYHMKSIGYMKFNGFELPNAYSYIRNLISRINECVDYHLKYGKRPRPADILSSLGQNYRELKMDGILYDVADLLMKQKGYKVKSGCPDTIEKIDAIGERKDLSIVAQTLLEILELSDEELKIKEQRDREKLVERQLDNLRPYLEEDIEDDIVEEKGPVLKKTKKSDKK